MLTSSMALQRFRLAPPPPSGCFSASHRRVSRLAARLMQEDSGGGEGAMVLWHPRSRRREIEVGRGGLHPEHCMRRLDVSCLDVVEEEVAQRNGEHRPKRRVRVELC